MTSDYYTAFPAGILQARLRKTFCMSSLMKNLDMYVCVWVHAVIEPEAKRQDKEIFKEKESNEDI